jgi:hypothetical protein
VAEDEENEVEDEGKEDEQVEWTKVDDEGKSEQKHRKVKKKNKTYFILFEYTLG